MVAGVVLREKNEAITEQLVAPSIGVGLRGWVKTVCWRAKGNDVWRGRDMVAVVVMWWRGSSSLGRFTLGMSGISLAWG